MSQERKKDDSEKKVKPNTDKYVKIPTTASEDEFRVMGERVQRGEVRWAYYCGDADKGHHYYLVLKK